MTKKSNQAILIFKRNFLLYVREKSFRMDQVFPFLTWVLLYSGKQTNNTGLLITSQYFLSMSLLSVTRGVTVSLIEEKSSRQREIQKIMGVSSGNYILGWLMTNVVRFIFVMIPFIILVTTTETLSDRDQGHVVTAFALFGLAQISLAYLVSVFFEDPRSGGDASMVASILGAFLVQLIEMEYIKNREWPSYIMSLVPSFAYGAINFQNIYLEEKHSQDLTYQYGHQAAYYMLLIDTFVFLISYWYFDQVLVNEYGTQKGYFFFLKMKSKPKPKSDFTSQAVSIGNLNEVLNMPLNISYETNDFSSAFYHEHFDNDKQFKKAIQMDGLSKRFKKVQAIDLITLSLYENQILTLLGHNGAGKTTLISLLTGLVQKDSGSVLFYGRSIDDNIDVARRVTGICLQRDVLYEMGTVEEHLVFYAKVKGVEYIEQEVNSVVNKCGLASERGKYAKDLSGGNRRKLCLAMAIIGGSQVIFLDEPTSGMDPVSRRKIWDILVQLKQEGKCLVLTTHHLDEAEVLSERIAVMSKVFVSFRIKGKLLTLGSSDFIKKNFGVGYHLHIFNNGDHKNWMNKQSRIKKLVQTSVPECRFNAISGNNTLSFQMPFDRKERFIPIFQTLESDKSITFDLYMNTLEEAFINIGLDENRFMRETRKFSTSSCHGDDPIEIENEKGDINDFSDIIPPACLSKISKYKFKSQFLGCFYRKIFTLQGQKLAIQLIIPTILILVGCAVTWANRDVNSKTWVLQASTSVSTSVIIATSMLSSSASSFLTMERQYSLKYALDVMGCRRFPYWTANLAFDFMLSGVLIFVYLASINIFDVDPLQSIGTVLVVTSSFFATITMGYLFQQSFSKYSSANRTLTLLLIFGGFVFPLILFLSNNSVILRYILLSLFPAITTMISFFMGTEKQFSGLPTAYWFYSAVMLIQGCLFLSLVIFIDTRSGSKPKTNIYEDSDETDDIDVKNETQRVLNPNCTDQIKALRLQKIFPNGYQGVRGSTFGVQAGEIFGLLGPNGKSNIQLLGAGKSTTFNLMTAALKPTLGAVFLNQKIVDYDDRKQFQQVGVCPQFDYVWKDIKIRQHLRIFGLIKGMNSDDIDNSIEYFIRVLQLEQFVKTNCDKLSGGNKRKLCVATALMGGTTIQFFDEPSSGVDPISRRFLWNAINQSLKAQKSALMMTTHQMDEAEELCSRIAIQVNGVLACIGTPQHLRQRFSQGYRVTLELMHVPQKQQVIELVLSRFPEVKFQHEYFTSRVSFIVPSKDFSFTETFTFFLNQLQDQLKVIKDFQINQSSLEQVFIYLSSQQDINSQESISEASKVSQQGIFDLILGDQPN